jgi:hypothetical protein
MRGMKTFESIEPHPATGEQFSSQIHPFQSFQRADYGAKPDREDGAPCPCATSPSKRWGNTAKVKCPSVGKYAFPSVAVASFFLWIALRRIRGRYDSATLSGTTRSPQRWLGAPSRTSKMSRRANLRASTARKTWKHAVFEGGIIR